MERVLTFESRADAADQAGPQIVDTTIVLFFLAVLIGSSLPSGVVDGVLTFTTLAAFITLPYFLMSEDDLPGFGFWALGRSFIAALGAAIGLVFSFAVGTALPDLFSYLPMTLLLVAATASAAVQFYVIIKVRLAN